MRTKYTLIALFTALITTSAFAQSSIVFDTPFPNQIAYSSIVSYNNVRYADITASPCSTYALQFLTKSSYITIGPLQNTSNALLTLEAYNATVAPKDFDITFSNDTTSLSFSNSTKIPANFGTVGCASASTTLPSTQYSYMRIMRQANNGGELLYLTKITISNGALPVELISFNAK